MSKGGPTFASIVESYFLHFGVALKRHPQTPKW